jgi:hypothetical protein
MDKDRVMGLVGQLEQFLQGHGVNYATVVRDLKVRLESVRDTNEIRREVRSLFGGMGSLNDLWISRANGDLVEDEKAANRELNDLRSELWREIG